MLYKSRIAGRRRIELVAIDWSGVISDDRRPVYEANMRILESRGIPRLKFDEWLPITQPGPAEFLAANGVTGNRAAIYEEYSAILAKVREEGISPVAYPDAKKILDRLAEAVQIVVISSHPRKHLVAEAAEYGISGCFRGLTGSVKDKGEAIRSACAENRREPGSTVYVGDMTYDILAARRAGARSAAVTTGYHVKERLAREAPDFIYDSLTELLAGLDPLLRR